MFVGVRGGGYLRGGGGGVCGGEGGGGGCYLRGGCMETAVSPPHRKQTCDKCDRRAPYSYIRVSTAGTVYLPLARPLYGPLPFVCVFSHVNNSAYLSTISLRIPCYFCHHRILVVIKVFVIRFPDILSQFPVGRRTSSFRFSSLVAYCKCIVMVVEGWMAK